MNRALLAVLGALVVVGTLAVVSPSEAKAARRYYYGAPYGAYRPVYVVPRRIYPPVVYGPAAYPYRRVYGGWTTSYPVFANPAMFGYGLPY